MTLKEFSDKGRTVYIEFKCMRCGHAKLEPYSEVSGRTGEHCGYLRQLTLPQGWRDFDFRLLLCDKCAQALSEFMQGGSGNG